MVHLELVLSCTVTTWNLNKRKIKEQRKESTQNSPRATPLAQDSGGSQRLSLDAGLGRPQATGRSALAHETPRSHGRAVREEGPRPAPEGRPPSGTTRHKASGGPASETFQEEKAAWCTEPTRHLFLLSPEAPRPSPESAEGCVFQGANSVAHPLQAGLRHYSSLPINRQGLLLSNLRQSRVVEASLDGEFNTLGSNITLPRACWIDLSLSFPISQLKDENTSRCFLKLFLMDSPRFSPVFKQIPKALHSECVRRDRPGQGHRLVHRKRQGMLLWPGGKQQLQT